MSNPKVRIALIGAGRWGRKYIKTINEYSGAVLRCVASSNPETRNFVSTDCTIIGNWREVVARNDIDGVIVATPPSSHAEIAEGVIAARLPVLIEKPLTMDLSQAKNLLAIADKLNAIVMVDHIHLYQPAYQVLKQHIKHPNSIRAIKAKAGNWGPFREDTPVIWDWGAHDIAMAIDLMDEPPANVLVSREEMKIVTGVVGESIRLNLDWPGNRIGEIILSNILKVKQRWLSVTTVQNTMIYDDLAPNKLINLTKDNNRRTVITLESTPPLNLVLSAFAQTIRLGVTDLRDLYLAVSVIETLERCVNFTNIGENN